MDPLHPNKKKLFQTNRKGIMVASEWSHRPTNLIKIIRNKTSSKDHQKTPQSKPSNYNLIPSEIKKQSATSKKILRLQQQQFAKNKPFSLINIDKLQKDSSKKSHSILSEGRQRQTKFLKANNKYRSYLMNYLNSQHQSHSQYRSLSKLDPNHNSESSFLRQSNPLPINIKFAHRTRQGAIFTNPNKPNQDNYVIVSNPKHNNYLFAVADGHGLQGHQVSQLAAKRLQQSFINKKKKQKTEIFLTEIFNQIQDQLYHVKDFDTENSGSTMVTVLLDKDKRQVTCANVDVGDSRAILARQVNKTNWEIVHLSEDHKPSLPKEKRRIIRKGGQVRCAMDQQGKPIGPERVWLPKKNYQGLAMSRSFGDNISKPIGVIHEPQIIQIGMEQRDRFIVLASDGVWEFISNLQILQLIIPFYKQKKLEECCDSILKLAYQRWTAEDSSVVDDITLILIFLHHF